MKRPLSQSEMEELIALAVEHKKDDILTLIRAISYIAKELFNGDHQAALEFFRRMPKP